MLLTLNGSANPITSISPKLRLAIKRLVTLSRFINRKIVMITKRFPETQIAMVILLLLRIMPNIISCSIKYDQYMA